MHMRLTLALITYSK